MKPVSKTMLNGLLAVGILTGALCLKWGQSTFWLLPMISVGCLAAYIYLFMKQSPD